MKALIRNVLKNECDKHVQRHFEYLENLQKYATRKSRRDGRPFTKSVHLRPWWQLAAQFNPFKVRTPKKLQTYAFTLARRLGNNTYKPAPAVIQYVRKENGKRRALNIFQLPDAAISNLVYKSLLRKNVGKLSSYAYAYREDKTPHDAIAEIHAEWKDLDRVYVAEYDFSKFFDNIDHSYLRRVLNSGRFVVSPIEGRVIDAFLRSTAAERSSYPNEAKERVHGIPQGTAVSLFLANVACWELDRALERLGVGFARYADDTVIWGPEYDRIVAAFGIIEEFGQKMGVPLNPDKSHGINLLSNVGAEIKAKQSITFLGYTLSLQKVAISAKNVAKIKARLSFIVYQNLVQPLRKGIFNPKQINVVDWDYVTALSQVRHYLYGGLTNEKLRSYISGKSVDLNFRGVMSYYPIVNDIEQLAKLDGWLAYVFQQSLRLRQKLWQAQGLANLPGPTATWIDDLQKLQTFQIPNGPELDLSFPSFRLINHAMRIAIGRKGLRAVANPFSRYYS